MAGVARGRESSSGISESTGLKSRPEDTAILGADFSSKGCREMQRLQIDRLKSENAKQALHLAGAIMLLKEAKDSLPSDHMIYLRIREFLDNEVGAE